MRARLEAAIRFLYPDEMTPTAKRVLESILAEYPSEAVPTGAASTITTEET